MPLTSFLSASGSLRRLLHQATYQKWPAASPSRRRALCHATCATAAMWLSCSHRSTEQPWTHRAHTGKRPPRERRRWYSEGMSTMEHYAEDETEILIANLGLSNTSQEEENQVHMHEHEVYDGFRAQLGRQRRKRQRQSRPATVLESIQSSARDLYQLSSPGKSDLSYRSPRKFKSTGLQRRRTPPALSEAKESSSGAQPTTLYTILGRYLEHHTAHVDSVIDFEFTFQELRQLRHNGFSTTSVEQWAACLLQPHSVIAARVFETSNHTPMFVLLLFLRRKHISAFALGIIMRHLDSRLAVETLSWENLKLLSTRLLRHARELWTEAMRWIAALFASQASKLFEMQGWADNMPPRLCADVTHFSNTILLLLSLPTKVHPLIGARHQEKSQFRILQFMASQTPAINVTRVGFRSVARVQLAHPKTPQEREWAQLKGPSWPPWKENRTAMDEDKGYEFGASRASKILHRMYEAGYRGRIWEEVAGLYAGWDSDQSPTIQTRTSLPHFTSQYRDGEHLRNLLWAGRVRTTRTRREAWACFLTHELSGAPTSEEVYLAMFEKIHYPEAEHKRPSKFDVQPALDETSKFADEPEEPETDLMPGDMKEVQPDPTSPLHYVYLSEPIPTFKSLYRRMHMQGLRPSNHLLAFLIEAAPSFEAFIEILEMARAGFNGGIGQLLDGVHINKNLVKTIPGYFWAAFIRTLCRHSHFRGTVDDSLTLLSPKEHSDRFKKDREYLFHYSQALLLHYKPYHRPAWAACIDNVIRSTHRSGTYGGQLNKITGRGLTQYKAVCNLLEVMEQIDLDIDDEIFNLVCAATMTATQIANRSGTYTEEAQFVLHTGSRRLRKLFYGLVGANTDMQHHTDNATNPIPPHIPGPFTFHAYVRALGTLRDYEGLYSFSTWLTRHHAEVTARAEAEHSGHRRLHKAIVALRVALTGYLEDGSDQQSSAPEEILQLVKTQLEEREEWGGWPDQEWVDGYVQEGSRRKKTR